MKIYIDADACPVKDSTIAIAKAADISVVLVTSFSHFSHATDPEHVKTFYVDDGADAADFKIMQLASKGDIVITQDYGLASLCLGKGCIVLHHNGFEYTSRNIDQLLHTRYTSAMARKSGQRTKGPKPYSVENETKFSQLLQKLLMSTGNE